MNNKIKVIAVIAAGVIASATVVTLIVKAIRTHNNQKKNSTK